MRWKFQWEAKTKSLEDEISKLNQTANNGEDVKAELETLKSQIAAEKAQAEADRILAEKTEAIKKRFEAVVGDKKFIHNAVREDYLKKFLWHFGYGQPVIFVV